MPTRTLERLPATRDRARDPRSAHARETAASTASAGEMAGLLLHLQRTVGNAAVNELLRRHALRRTGRTAVIDQATGTAAWAAGTGTTWGRGDTATTATDVAVRRATAHEVGQADPTTTIQRVAAVVPGDAREARNRRELPLVHVQRYAVVAAGLHANTAPGALGNVNFAAQEKNLVSRPPTAADPGPHPAVSTFVAPNNLTNIVAAQNVALRVSDDGRMAVEDSTLATRQPKTFFGEPGLVDESNSALRSVGSKYLLTVAGGQSLQVADQHGHNHTLAEVRPIKLSAQGARPTGAWSAPTVAEDCNNVAKDIIGLAEQTAKEQLNPARTLTPPRTTDANTNNVDFESRLAYYVEQYVASRMTGAHHLAAKAAADTATAHVAATTGLLPGGMTATINAAAQRYGTYLRANPPALADAVRDLGINQFASSEVGHTYVTTSLGRPANIGVIGAPIPDWSDLANPGAMKSSSGTGQIWMSHYGAVVAKDGHDVMTLQNYNRTEEDRGAGVGGARIDDRYYVQMYGPATRIDPTTGRDQSWHTAWQYATRGFANPISFVLGAQEQYALSANVQAVIADGQRLGVFTAAEAWSVGRFLRIKASPELQTEFIEHYRGGVRKAFQGALRANGTNRRINDRLQAAKATVLRHYWESAGLDLAETRRRKASLVAADVGHNTPQATLKPLLLAYGVPAAIVTGVGVGALAL